MTDDVADSIPERRTKERSAFTYIYYRRSGLKFVFLVRTISLPVHIDI
jgi:hypothetical protein